MILKYCHNARKITQGQLKYTSAEIQSFVSRCVSNNVFINLCELDSIDHSFRFVQTKYRISNWTQFKKVISVWVTFRLFLHGLLDFSNRPKFYNLLNGRVNESGWKGQIWECLKEYMCQRQYQKSGITGYA